MGQERRETGLQRSKIETYRSKSFRIAAMSGHIAQKGEYSAAKYLHLAARRPDASTDGATLRQLKETSRLGSVTLRRYRAPSIHIAATRRIAARGRGE